MAREAKAKTDAQKNFEKARDAHKKAKEANKKNDNDTTKAALKSAKDAFDAAKKVAARDRFVRIGNIRVGNVLKQMTGVGQMNVPASYSYTASDVDQIEKLVADKAKAMIAALRAGLEKAPAKDRPAAAAIFTA